MKFVVIITQYWVVNVCILGRTFARAVNAAVLRNVIRMTLSLIINKSCLVGVTDGRVDSIAELI